MLRNRVYKTEIKPSEEQKILINKHIGCCRFLFNHYIAKNKEQYEKYKNGEVDKGFIGANEFNKYINHELSKELPWIKEHNAKARKKALENGEIAFKRFFKGLGRFPKFKKKKNQDIGVYISKSSLKSIEVQRHRIKVPNLKWIRIKEYGYVPNGYPTSVTITKKANRYYISILYKEEIEIPKNDSIEGIGVDVGLKEFAVFSNGEIHKNINKTSRVRKLEKKLKREQKKLSRKYEVRKKGGEGYKNIQKQILIIQKLHQRLANIRTNHIKMVVNALIKTKPKYITIEDLNVRGMMKNRNLSKTIAQQKFYEFRTKLEYKCKLNGIELRVVDKFDPFSINWTL
ncbi:MAG: transposase [Marinisporobacter sp.]|nr:transposase [Marinisporobacter sp.]